jgi:tetratricopeptide (TPR) repeat protein
MNAESRNTREKFFASMAALCALALVLFVLREPLVRALTRNVAWLTVAQDVTTGDEAQICPVLHLANHAPSSPALNFPVIGGLYAYAVRDDVRAHQEFARVNEPTAVDLFWLGCAAWRAGDKARALDVWRDAGAESYFIQRAKSAYQARDVSRAVALYEIGLQLAPNSKEGWDDLAEMQFDRAVGGQLSWNAAFPVFEHQIELDPENAMAHYRIGYGLWTRRGDWERAETELRFAWARDKNWLIAYALGSLLVDRGKSEQAVELLEYAFSKSDNAWTRFNRMRAYAGVGRCADAEIARTELLSAYPDMLNPLRAWCRANAACGCKSLP